MKEKETVTQPRGKKENREQWDQRAELDPKRTAKTDVGVETPE